MKKIIVINGTGGSGKDTFVELVSTIKKVYNVSSVDKVKEIAKICGWNGEKKEKDRKFLSDLKLLLIDYNDLPFNDICEKIEKFNNLDDEIMFIHIREPEEIDRVVKKCNAITLLIKRKGLENIETNSSDFNVDNYEYNYYINNDGTIDDLKEEATKFISELEKNN